MDKKATSKPMREITGRLMTCGEFEIIVFGDKARFWGGGMGGASVCMRLCVVVARPAPTTMQTKSSSLLDPKHKPSVTSHHITSQTNHHSINTQVILEEPVERWPRVDALLSWHSDGFPLRKAQAYAALRRPFLVNDVGMQDVLLDRRRVYRLLQVRMCV